MHDARMDRVEDRVSSTERPNARLNRPPQVTTHLAQAMESLRREGVDTHEDRNEWTLALARGSMGGGASRKRRILHPRSREPSLRRRGHHRSAHTIQERIVLGEGMH